MLQAYYFNIMSTTNLGSIKKENLYEDRISTSFIVNNDGTPLTPASNT